MYRLESPDLGALIRALKGLGKLILDDFGTRYSSLSYLKRLTVDFLKTDRSFVEGFGKISKTKESAPRRSTSHVSGVEVIAEGVESAKEATRLRRLGCCLAQGSYFSKSLPAEAAGALLTGGSPLGNNS